jgi:pantoate--beta-alanine ligase
MLVVHDPGEFRDACERARASGLRVGLVPTMGALHDGHMHLVERARSRASFVALTIFVNPLQFGPNEDFSRYPRTLEADLARCAATGVDLVFAPAKDAMYPAGFSSHVDVVGLTDVLEGAHRPGHFRGVCTVVTKLFQLTGPSVAVFGRKDYQQYRVLERMARDLDMPIDVVGIATVREPDGLALSSRNRYLSPEDRTRALAIARGLRAATDAFMAGERDGSVLASLVRAPIAEAFDSIDYVEICDPETLQPLATGAANAMAIVAARIGTTRLIDNSVFGVDPRP